MGYAIRPAVNPDFQSNIGCLIKRPAGGILLEAIQETSGRSELIILLALETAEAPWRQVRPNTKGRYAIAFWGSYQPTLLAETPRPSRRR
jgi:hypothetical protein